MASQRKSAGASEKQVHRFGGRELDVSWDGRLCIHVGECTRASGDIFKSGRQPWGEPDRAPAAEVAAVVRRCPTGALTFERRDGGAAETAEGRNVVVIANDGPLYVRGDLDIGGAADDMPGVRYRAALCRCGQSRNKPFCDGSHEAAGFRDHGAVGETGELGSAGELRSAGELDASGRASAASPGEPGAESPAGEAGHATDGTLQIRPAANGPLLFSGRFTIRAASGRVAWHGTKAALCRCGHSKNKPFCDGSHAGAGFKAE